MIKISSRKPLNKNEMNAQRLLLSWCQSNLDGYTNIRVKDFKTSWRDGRAFIAILNRHRPDKISLNGCNHRSNVDNLRMAFEFAEREFGVAQIIDPEGMEKFKREEKYINRIINSF